MQARQLPSLFLHLAAADIVCKLAYMAPPGIIVFDAVGTILHPSPDVAQAYLDVGGRHSSCLDARTVQMRFKTAFARQEALDAQAGNITNETRERQRWRD